MEVKNIQLVPYLHFEGNCEEALNFYKDILDGTIEITTRYDNPAMKAPEYYKDKILHARFYFNGNTIYASDVFPGVAANKSSGDAALSLSIPDEETAKIVFDKLSEGGKINVPFEKQFWGGWHGNFVDRYGIRWMVNF